MIDLDAYCARIGYAGPRTPTLETLRALHSLHPAAIPFEAIDVLLDRDIDLAPAAVDDKLLRRRRGGYCYEQNSLFKRALAAMGFAVEGLVARVAWMVPADEPPRPRTHMALRIALAGEAWLADVGFGGLVLTAPLRFAIDAAQPTPHETFRLTPLVGGGHRLDARIESSWRPVYELSDEVQLDGDYAVPNWFLSKHSSSHFRHDLTVARTTAQARYKLLNNRLTVQPPQGEAERRHLTAGELETVLREVFGLAVEPAWRPLLAAIVERGNRQRESAG